MVTQLKAGTKLSSQLRLLAIQVNGKLPLFLNAEKY
jgi:hypothetical protein